jgi:hypothetical protein
MPGAMNDPSDHDAALIANIKGLVSGVESSTIVVTTVLRVEEVS